MKSIFENSYGHCGTTQSITEFTMIRMMVSSGVARAFLGGQLTDPEGQNEEENK